MTKLTTAQKAKKSIRNRINNMINDEKQIIIKDLAKDMKVGKKHVQAVVNNLVTLGKLQVVGTVKSTGRGAPAKVYTKGTGVKVSNMNKASVELAKQIESVITLTAITVKELAEMFNVSEQKVRYILTRMDNVTKVRTNIDKRVIAYKINATIDSSKYFDLVSVIKSLEMAM